MVKVNDIMRAINNLLVKAFPSSVVYLGRCPKDFMRPSFLIEHVRSSRREVNKTIVEKTVYLTITCFVPVDEYYRSDQDALSDLQEKVINLFNEPVIVNDRAIYVQSSDGGKDFDQAYIDIQLTFCDDRSDTVVNLPLMGTVETNILEG